MFRIISKKVSTILVCSALVLFNIAPTFANTTVAPAVNTANIASAASCNTLVDGSSCTQSVQAGHEVIFFINTLDTDARSIIVNSSAPVKSRIVPANHAFDNYFLFKSGEFHSMNFFSRHFVPGIQYLLIVSTENNGQSWVDVTASMSKGNHASWVRMGHNAIYEKNALYGGEAEHFGIAFEEKGTYRISVATSGYLLVKLNSDPSSYVTSPLLTQVKDIEIDIPNGSNFGQYVLTLLNTNSSTPGNSYYYTVSIEKIK